MNVAQTFEIEYNAEGDKFTTSIFQLLQWKYGLKLEKEGMKMKGGRSISSHLRRLLGLTRQADIKYLEDYIEGILEEVTPL